MENEKYGNYPYPIIEKDNTLWEALFNGDLEASKMELLMQKERPEASKFDYEKSILNLSFVVEEGSMGDPLERSSDRITDLVPFIVHAEAQHPGNFLKYKSILEFVDRTAGAGSILRKWKEHEADSFSHHGHGVNYGGKKIIYSYEKVDVSDQMKGYFQNLILKDAIAKGDVETAKKVLSEISKGPLSSVRIDWAGQLIPSRKMGRADLVSWILKSEHDHPGHFLDYKEILDFVAQKDGTNKVIDRWKHPIYWCILRSQKEGQKLVSLSVPTSPQMLGYLGHLEDVRTVYVPTNDPSVLKKGNKNAAGR